MHIIQQFHFYPNDLWDDKYNLPYSQIRANKRCGKCLQIVESKKIHLIGIGGIGVSALAQFYLSRGHKVSGSDLARSEITDFLKQKGAKIFIGNFAKNINRDFDLIVFSPAVKKNNDELKQAKKYKIKAISYPEALGELTKEYYTIAVAGAHGKSTTTAMAGLVLAEAGLDPTVIVGTKVKEFEGSNFRNGNIVLRFKRFKRGAPNFYC